jgi:hypothetical protein
VDTLLPARFKISRSFWFKLDNISIVDVKIIARSIVDILVLKMLFGEFAELCASAGSESSERL